MIISPDNTFGVDTLTKNKEAIKKLYEKGYQDGEKINTLILPVNSFSEKQLKEFHLQLEEKVHGKTGNA